MSEDSSVGSKSEMTANEIMNLLFDGKKVTVSSARDASGLDLFLGNLRAAKSRMTRQFAAVGMVLSEQDLVLRHKVASHVDALAHTFMIQLWLEPKVKTTFRILAVEDNPAAGK